VAISSPAVSEGIKFFFLSVNMCACVCFPELCVGWFILAINFAYGAFYCAKACFNVCVLLMYSSTKLIYFALMLHDHCILCQ
jgi:hypothetical protein